MALLASATTYTATVTTGVQDLSGNNLAIAYSWSFTSLSTTPPTVTAVTPAIAGTGVVTTSAVTASFSEALAPATINTSTFQLEGPSGAVVPSAVVYDAPGGRAILKQHLDMSRALGVPCGEVKQRKVGRVLCEAAGGKACASSVSVQP